MAQLAYTQRVVPDRSSPWSLPVLKSGANRPLSLRLTLAVVVGLMSLIPNVVMGLLYVLPNVGENPSIWQGFALWLLVVGLLSALMGYVISTILLRPLIVLADEVSSLARPGVRLAAVQLAKQDGLPSEIQTLRLAFSGALEALRSEQTKRGAFMATLVHDLKTPIVAANHVLEVIETQESLGREDRVRLISHMRQENEATLALVQRMVDAHRFERETIELRLELIDLAALAQRMAQRFRVAADARGLRIVCGGSGRALASAGELERACANLLENALRYARSTIRLEVGGSSLTVADDGPGMQSDLDLLAQPFNSQRVELAGQEFTAGTGGLGLFIARQIVLAHGGSLERLYDRPGTALRIALKGELMRP